jgi:excisionase family DNA binding protein
VGHALNAGVPICIWLPRKTAGILTVGKNILEHEILTIREIAFYLRVSRVTVWRWCQAGLLPAHQLGRSWRIYQEDLLRFLEKPAPDPADYLAVDGPTLEKRDS